MVIVHFPMVNSDIIRTFANRKNDISICANVAFSITGNGRSVVKDFLTTQQQRNEQRIDNKKPTGRTRFITPIKSRLKMLQEMRVKASP